MHRFRVTEQCRLDNKNKHAGRHSRVDRKSLLNTCGEEALFMSEVGRGRRSRRRRGNEQVKNDPLTITVRRGPVCLVSIWSRPALACSLFSSRSLVPSSASAFSFLYVSSIKLKQDRLCTHWARTFCEWLGLMCEYCRAHAFGDDWSHRAILADSHLCRARSSDRHTLADLAFPHARVCSATPGKRGAAPGKLTARR